MAAYESGRSDKSLPLETSAILIFLRWVHVFASSSDWFIGLFMTVEIGQSNYFGFGFTTPN